MARVVGCAAVLSMGVEAARVQRKRRAEHRTEFRTDAPSTKFIADVPVLNYDLAFADQPSLAGTEGVVQDWNVVVDATTKDDAIHYLCQMAECRYEGHPSEGGVPFFQVRATEAELETMLASAHGVAKFVEPDSKVRLIPELQAEPEAATWGLNRIGGDQRSSSGAGSHIYILDTGIRTSHDEFGGRAIATLDQTGFINNRECKSWSPFTCANDNDGHGTHCAGSAAGASYGVAPAATLHAVKVLGDDGGGSWSWTYDALDWVATKGDRPAVASLSLGGYGTQNAMKTAVDAAVASGVTVVVAAGNENDNACRYSPAFVPSAITVGATTSNDSRSSFSNFGACTNIWAPGSRILSAGHRSDTDTATFDGTSMACPHVSGAVALVQQKNPDANSAKILSTLIGAAETGKLSGLKSTDTNKLLQVVGF